MIPDRPRSEVRGPWLAAGRPIARRAPRRGFTLIELLVVILIILLISAVALPTILPALNHRQISEASRILQGALVGARDKAIHDGQPSGIRLLPDPGFYSLLPTTGTINPYAPLAYNRIVPIEPAPEYSEGMCTTVPLKAYAGTNPPFAYQISLQVSLAWTPAAINPYVLTLVQSAITPGTGMPNSPTSWYWNIRIGDKVQLNNAGPWYTVIGPSLITTPEGFVNVGQPGVLGAASGVPLITTAAGSASVSNYVEYLFLVNGIDDNQDGYVDNGWDGVDNDGDGLFEEYSCQIQPFGGEWESESWIGTYADTPGVNIPYTIRRRPVPTQGAREIALPTSVVVDATSWSLTRERSRLPVNVQSGLVDVMVNPDGTVFYNSPYGAPTSFGLGDAFYHFWLAERQDVVPIDVGSNGTPITLNNGAAPYYLPIAQPGSTYSANYPSPYLKGDYSVLTLNTRTGQIAVNENPPFLNYSGIYNATYPFLQAEQGVNGGP